MTDRARIADPKTHYGNARAATRGFIRQRITGAINIVFAVFLVWFVVSLAGAPDTTAQIALVRNPLVALPLALLMLNVALHMRIGMHDVIEDYISKGPRNSLANTANLVFVAAVTVLVVGALAKLVIWG